MKGTAKDIPTSQPQLIAVPSRQSQYHHTALKKILEVQPMIPHRKTTKSITTQKSTCSTCLREIDKSTVAHFKRMSSL